jgi:hypothetical protein
VRREGEDSAKKDPHADYSVQEHIENGKLSTQLISTTKKKAPQIFIIKMTVK